MYCGLRGDSRTCQFLHAMKEEEGFGKPLPVSQESTSERCMRLFWTRSAMASHWSEGRHTLIQPSKSNVSRRGAGKTRKREKDEESGRTGARAGCGGPASRTAAAGAEQ